MHCGGWIIVCAAALVAGSAFGQEAKTGRPAGKQPSIPAEQPGVYAPDPGMHVPAPGMYAPGPGMYAPAPGMYDPGPGIYAPGVPLPTRVPPGAYVTTHGSVHLHIPRRPCFCERPAAVCIKPKMWKFSQAAYQLHHELWHGVIDPCWLMDPNCCESNCHHAKSAGLLDVARWTDHTLFWWRPHLLRRRAVMKLDEYDDCAAARPNGEEVQVLQAGATEAPAEREARIRSILLQRK